LETITSGYYGHVYRIYNFCLTLHECSDEDKKKIAIAACHHGIGLWSDHTVGYIEPSVAQVKQYHNAACISVRVRGPGIPEHLIETIFRPFYRESSRNRSTGAGACYCSAISRNAWLARRH